MNFEGFDYGIFANSVEDVFEEPLAQLISSKETMLAGGSLAKIKSRITKASFYLNELIQKVEDLTPEKIGSADPVALDNSLRMILKVTEVPSGIFED
jgi:hypothetical protein